MSRNATMFSAVPTPPRSEHFIDNLCSDDLKIKNKEKVDYITIYTVKDIQNIFKCGLKQAYEIVNANGFPTIRIGKKIIVEKKALEQWLHINKGKSILL